MHIIKLIIFSVLILWRNIEFRHSLSIRV